MVDAVVESRWAAASEVASVVVVSATTMSRMRSNRLEAVEEMVLVMAAAVVDVVVLGVVDELVELARVVVVVASVIV